MEDDEQNKQNGEGKKESVGKQVAKQAAEQAAKQAAEQAAEQAKQAIKQEIKEVTRKAAKEAAKAASKAIKEAAGAIAKAIAPAIPYILAAVIIIVLIVAAYYAIVNSVREATSESASSTSSLVEIGDNGPVIASGEELIEKINAAIEELGIDAGDLNLGSESQQEAYLYKFMTASLATQLPYIKDSTAKKITDIALNIVTLGLVEGEQEVQGIVKIKRQTDDSTKTLDYKNYEDFEELIENNDEDALDYFTLTDDWMLCIAKCDKTVTTTEITTTTGDGSTTTQGTPTETVTITEVQIPYQTIISKYSISFDFFITLQQITQNAEYVSAVADLIEDGEIVITIFDSTQTYTTEYTYECENWERYSYTEEVTVETEDSSSSSSSSGSSSSSSTSSDSSSNLSSSSESTLIPGLSGRGSRSSSVSSSSRASSSSFSTPPSTPPSTPSSSSSAPSALPGSSDSTDSDDSDNSGTSSDSSTTEQQTTIVTHWADRQVSKETTKTMTVQTLTSVTVDVTNANVWVISKNATYKQDDPEIEYPLGIDGVSTEPTDEQERPTTDEEDEWKENIVETNFEKVEKRSWVADTNDVQIDSDKFLGLWKNGSGSYIKNASFNANGIKVKYQIPTSKKYDAPIDNVLSAEEMLYDQLERSENTQTHAQIMRYLVALYKADGDTTKVDVTLDLSIFETSSFNSIGTIEGGTIQEKVWNALINAGFSEYAAAGALGNIHYESSFNASAVEGGYDENTGGIGICQWTNTNRGTEGRNTSLKNYATSKGTVWQNEDIQIEFLLTELLGTGDAVGYASKQLMTTTNDRYGRIWYSNEWEDAEDVETATRAFCYTFERPGTNAASSSMATRIALAQSYYEKYAGTSGDRTGDVVRYYQNDYSNVAYGNSNISKCGCGPTAFAMVATQLSGRTITPADAVAWCGNAYYVSGSGTSWAYFSAAASYFGLDTDVVQTSSFQAAKNALMNGKLVICSQGKGLFTNGGHYILLTKIESGKIYVNDPNKTNAIAKGYNSRGFTEAEITQAAKQYWIFE